MIRLLFFVSIYLLFINASHQETCDDEIAREREEDWKQHSCRSCKPLTLDASAHCPQTEYDCDPDLPMTSNMLHEGCECAHLKCADEKATLAVNGTLLGRLRCADSVWKTRTDDVVTSGICAMKCGFRVCKTLPDDFFTENPLYVPFVVRPPDGEHPCAWGTCENGAVGSTGSATVPYEGLAAFSCAGDGRWKGLDEKKHDYIMCSLSRPCTKLDTWDAAECIKKGGDSTPCYDPIESTTTSFDCGTGRYMVFYSGDLTYVESKCVNGGWMYSIFGEAQALTQEQFDARYPKQDQKFSCV